MTSMTGGCLCGKIRYEITEEPKGCCICHCRSCQKATGGTNIALVIVGKDDIKVEGEPKEYSTPGSSGQLVHRKFCGDCGTTMMGHPEALGDLRSVSAVTLDDPSAVSVNMELWTCDAQSWDISPEGTQRFEKNPTAPTETRT